MSTYENMPHGTPDFPIGVHDTHCADGFRLYPHTHREFEFLVLEEGHGNIFIDGAEYALSPGDGAFVNSRALHLGQRSDPLPCRFFAIVFAPEFLGAENDLIFQSYVRPVEENKITLPAVYRREIDWQREVLNKAVHIHGINKKRPPCGELIIKEELFGMWRLCFMHSEKNSASVGSGLGDMISAMEFIRARYALPLSLKDIASSINMSEGYFCRKFSAAMHITPFEYLLRIRVDNSCRMLRDSDAPVGEIAVRCGFNSFSYFSKRFKEFVGCTPQEYRKGHKKIPFGNDEPISSVPLPS